MTTSELKQIFFINKEIKMWELELEKARTQAEVKTKKLSSMPFANTNDTSDPTADAVIRITDIEMIILGKKKELELKRKEIIQFILQIADSSTRMIVKFRCVDCMTWEDVANEVSSSPDAVRKQFNRFCRKQDEMSDLSDCLSV